MLLMVLIFRSYIWYLLDHIYQYLCNYYYLLCRMVCRIVLHNGPFSYSLLSVPVRPVEYPNSANYVPLYIYIRSLSFWFFFTFEELKSTLDLRVPLTRPVCFNSARELIRSW
jgi:hypothetical protein